MFTTYEEYFGEIEDGLVMDFNILKDCAIELGDTQLLKKMLCDSGRYSRQKIDKYAKMIENIAIDESKSSVVETLQINHFVY